MLLLYVCYTLSHCHVSKYNLKISEMDIFKGKNLLYVFFHKPGVYFCYSCYSIAFLQPNLHYQIQLVWL